MDKLNEKLKNIKLLAMDVDGTLTDKGVYYSVDGLALKKFSVHDGMGISLLNQSNIETMIISSDDTEIPVKRAEKLKITHKVVAARRKSVEITKILLTSDIKFQEVAYIGDDINDIEAMEMCGFSACPSDATDEVKKNVDFVSDFPSGNGAVRQICEMILKAQEKPITLIY
ncbi:MAG: HAD hydrolase family protein [Firmicutes bacterium]|nr:HAD hydrolase family protein [Bacillota bacterium]